MAGCANGGTGSLNITNINGDRTTDSNIYVGIGSGSNGTLSSTNSALGSDSVDNGALVVGGITGTTGSGGTGSASFFGNGITNYAGLFGSGIYIGRNGTGTLNLTNGAVLINNEGGSKELVSDIVIGDMASGNGTATLANGNFNSNGYISVGGGERSMAITAGGVGVLDLNTGSSTDASLGYIVGASGGNGTITLTGKSGANQAATMMGFGSISVGDGGTGEINAEAYSSVTGDGLFIGGNGGTGTVIFSGATSQFASANLFGGTGVVIGANSSGAAGTGTLDVESGNLVEASSVSIKSGGTLNVESGGTLEAHQLNLTPGATMNLTGGIIEMADVIFTSGTNTITAANFDLSEGGTLEGQGEVSGNVINEGTINGGFEITGNLTQTTSGTIVGNLFGGAVRIDGNASFNGTFDIPFPASNPFLSEQFHVLSFGTETGAFQTLDLPALPNNWFWNTSSLYTTGIIVIVPEPRSIAIAMGASIFLMRRRTSAYRYK